MQITIGKWRFLDGGENGIRTHERIAPLHAFQACAFNHSATSPKLHNRMYIIYQINYTLDNNENL